MEDSRVVGPERGPTLTVLMHVASSQTPIRALHFGFPPHVLLHARAEALRIRDTRASVARAWLERRYHGFNRRDPACRQMGWSDDMRHTQIDSGL